MKKIAILLFIILSLNIKADDLPLIDQLFNWMAYSELDPEELQEAFAVQCYQSHVPGMATRDNWYDTVLFADLDEAKRYIEELGAGRIRKRVIIKANYHFDRADRPEECGYGYMFNIDGEYIILRKAE